MKETFVPEKERRLQERYGTAPTGERRRTLEELAAILGSPPSQKRAGSARRLPGRSGSVSRPLFPVILGPRKEENHKG